MKVKNNKKEMSKEEVLKNTDQEVKQDANAEEVNEKSEQSLGTDEKDDKIQELGEKLAELNDKYLRIYSEYENYRKRTAVEKSDLIINGGKDVLKAILPIVDDMERSLVAISDDSTREGQQLIYNKLMNTLLQKGVKQMDVVGQKFDENLHEAITQIPAPSDEQKGTVIDVVEKGYFLNDKVLRYAKVVVAV